MGLDGRRCLLRTGAALPAALDETGVATAFASSVLPTPGSPSRKAAAASSAREKAQSRVRGWRNTCCAARRASVSSIVLSSMKLLRMLAEMCERVRGAPLADCHGRGAARPRGVPLTRSITPREDRDRMRAILGARVHVLVERVGRDLHAAPLRRQRRSPPTAPPAPSSVGRKHRRRRARHGDAHATSTLRDEHAHQREVRGRIAELLVAAARSGSGAPP